MPHTVDKDAQSVGRCMHKSLFNYNHMRMKKKEVRQTEVEEGGEKKKAESWQNDKRGNSEGLIDSYPVSSRLQSSREGTGRSHQ